MAGGKVDYGCPYMRDQCFVSPVLQYLSASFTRLNAAFYL